MAADALLSIYNSEPQASGWPYTSPGADQPRGPSEATLARRALLDDDALISLVQQDKRYLASDLVIARVIQWTLDAQLAQKDLPTPVGRKEKYAERGALALRRLEQLANAVRAIGEVRTVQLIEFADVVKQALRRVTRAVKLLETKRWPHLNTLAVKCRLELDVVEMLNRTKKRPSVVAAMLEEVRLKFYRATSSKTMRRYYDAARAFDLFGNGFQDEHL